MPCDRHPWTYRGEPASGGLLRPKQAATERHPTHKGRLYLVGYGWLWLSGWAQQDGSVRLAAEPMTSDQVDHYCRPSEPQAQPAGASAREPAQGARPGGAADGFDWKGAEQAEAERLASAGHARASGGPGGGGPLRGARGSHPVTESPAPSQGEGFDDDIPF